MFERYRDLFGKHPAPAVVLEIPVHKRLEPLDEDSREAVKALENHPGWRYLMGKLRLQRQFLDTKLHERQADLRNVDFIQSGLFWTAWLDEQVRKEVEREQRPVVKKSLTNPEMEALAAAQAAIEVIGQN